MLKREQRIVGQIDVGFKLTILIIALNVSGVSTPVKKQRLSDWGKKAIFFGYLWAPSFKHKDIHMLKIKAWIRRLSA